MEPVLFDESETYTVAAKPKKPFRRFLGALILLAILPLGFVLLALEATEPFGTPDGCTMCHEMKPVRERWEQSSHHANASGVSVTCIKCHLPDREDTFPHIYGKASKGASHGWTHFFGKFDETASRQLVLDTMKNDRCLHCHNNLLAKPSTPAVGSVHATAIERTETREYACVSCHDTMHSPRPPKPDPKYYDEADNSYCYVCHVNYKKEPLADKHRLANIGCYGCHGESLAHSKDEDNATAPDIMFLKPQINMTCGKSGCHSEPKMQKVKSHKAWYATPVSERKKITCTDCHGAHVMKTRQRKWDKKTKKLIWRDGHDVDPNAEPTTKPTDDDSMDMDGMGM